jgi:hypothetical protein
MIFYRVTQKKIRGFRELALTDALLEVREKGCRNCRRDEA